MSEAEGREDIIIRYSFYRAFEIMIIDKNSNN